MQTQGDWKIRQKYDEVIYKNIRMHNNPVQLLKLDWISAVNLIWLERLRAGGEGDDIGWDG